MIEATMASWDQMQLFYRAWLPVGAARRAVLLFHRGHEHSGRWEEIIDALAGPETAVFAWDQRGHGKSAGQRGHAESLAGVVRDAEAFARHVCSAYGFAFEDMFVIAHSVGAVIAAAWVHDYAPPLRGMALAAPAFRVKLYVPLAVPFLRLKQKLLGVGFIKSYVKPGMLTHDHQQAEKYAADPLIFRQIATNILLDLHDISRRLVADAGAIVVPTLILAAGTDWVVETGAAREFFERLGSPIKQFTVLKGFYHAIFHERNRHEAVALTRTFMDECFAAPSGGAGLLTADRGGYTRTEYDLLRAPAGRRWALMRAGLRVGGRASYGLRLGGDAGFDSGVMLDYVYENRPRGFTTLGRLIDRKYLNSIGWRGIRQRRAHLQAELRQIIAELHGAGRPVRVLDAASGPGRYLLETLAAMPDIPSHAILRDNKPENLDAARRLAAQLGVVNVTVEAGNAFDTAALAAIEPRVTIAIVSGLFELIPENTPVAACLAGLADALEPDGLLIYTCQPWHPQLEFIARTLINRDGRPWIMRRRTQAEMDALVRHAGFEKVRQEIDCWGMFSVAVARRRPH